MEACLDYQSAVYKDAYSRINALVIEGEAQAVHNYEQLAELIPAEAETLRKLAAMENRHRAGFTACGRNLQVEPDMAFAKRFFQSLEDNFRVAADTGDLAACLVIQSLIIECFAIAAYNIYIPVADEFARRITENVVKDEYLHLNFGQEYLQRNFDQIKAGVERANAVNLPLVWQMLNGVTEDAQVLGMEREALVEDFMIGYGGALGEIGFSTREVMKMSSHGLRGV
ncbi:aldehyde oxygenase (deformylating) [Candidatus Cyanaurora vandensis]|uniref:aldehyde oxygenase (deformylating) n=1 Tax=Candidatus Cyanaurora vandensis TaxID=2714958 RepID=UPI00257AF269|nr:aldehyde oxygenase (deformylating) [Candidatus Cyanaurora vandensis]